MTLPIDHIVTPTEADEKTAFKPLRSLDVFAGCGGIFFMYSV